MHTMQPLIDWVMTPLAYNFMQRGMLAAVMVGVLCAVLGCYVVLRSMAFLGDAMAHAVLPGVAIAYLLGGNLVFGALAVFANIPRRRIDPGLEPMSRLQISISAFGFMATAAAYVVLFEYFAQRAALG